MIRAKVTVVEKSGFKGIQDVADYFHEELAINQTNRILSNEEILLPILKDFKKEGDKHE